MSLRLPTPPGFDDNLRHAPRDATPDWLGVWSVEPLRCLLFGGARPRSGAVARWPRRHGNGPQEHGQVPPAHAELHAADG